MEVQYKICGVTFYIDRSDITWVRFMISCNLVLYLLDIIVIKPIFNECHSKRKLLMCLKHCHTQTQYFQVQAMG